ncbi:MAG TPA: SDR family oxidoreductase [Phycisphaerae bacterium]|nr:SDR family oxidoreductase [Phycisphaerae bacterium]HOJ72314.1 SDR family oxidoreductase [Phycisphaerae bacterium]HOM50024.1 SDR family oxidoreductase [Phycisphaerae bacterium]HON65331.1 SDR family oxidoreductase [Phycisphaerae bacterium]HOQ84728.1 SDR family oxidoreductase [Phycisphaerae bacterium]
MPRLANEVAIITGAGTGIGAATAELFVREGAAVVINGRRREKLEEVAAKIGQPDRVAVLPGDIRERATAQEAVRVALERFGRLDIAVSNAAFYDPAPFPEADFDQWRKMFDVIMLGAFHLARETAQAMIASKTPGRIVAVTSIHGTQAEPRASSYGAAKAAVNQFTRCMAVELAPHGIRANAVAPGFVNTPMSVYEGKNELESEWFKKNYVEGRRIPLARPASPEEIAPVILFLASTESSYVTGHVLVADGGLTCTF